MGNQPSLSAGVSPTQPTDWAAARDDLLNAVPRLTGQIVFVSNEIGWGVVPLGEATRRFVDEAGRLNQALAQRCDRVTLVAAGLPLRLKDRP